LGLIRAADTRMAGHFIAFQRMLRLKDALSSTIASSEFIRLRVAKEETLLLKDETLWECLSDIVRAAFPALRVLRLADKKTAGMDKLYYYVRKTDVTITLRADKLNHIASKEVQTKLKSFLSTVKTDDDDDSVDSENEDSDYDTDESNDGTNDDGHDGHIPFETNDEGYAYDMPHDFQIAKTDIVGLFRQAWNKRRKKLVHDYSIAGWMLSPIPDIMEDAAKNNKGFHRLAVDRLIKKLMAPSGDYATEEDRHEAVGHLLNTFWTEHEHFHSKGGPFANREHIWQSKDIHGKVIVMILFHL
jgi:hypothetical protein